MISLTSATLIAIATYIFTGGHIPAFKFKKINISRVRARKNRQADQDFLEFLWNLKSDLSTGQISSKIETQLPVHELTNRLQLILDLSKTTGTPLTPVINRFIKQTKNRIELKQEIASELASTKATVLILASLPVLGIFLSSLLSGNSINWLFGTSAGRICLALGIMLNLAGLLWINRIINKSLRA